METAIATMETAIVVATLDRTAEDRVKTAATRLYDAEGALHAARQSHVDSWVAAAYDRLHEAVEDYRFALAVRSFAPHEMTLVRDGPSAPSAPGRQAPSPRPSSAAARRPSPGHETKRVEW
jgi:hypothetical protein